MASGRLAGGRCTPRRESGDRGDAIGPHRPESRNWLSTMQLARLVMCLGVVGGAILSCHLPTKIRGYHGDGAISRVRSLIVPGFQIDFSRFSLASPYETELSLQGLPEHWDDYVFNLVVAAPGSEKGRRPRIFEEGAVGTIRLRVIGVDGSSIMDSESSFDRMEWTWRRDDCIGTMVSTDPPDVLSSIPAAARDALADPEVLKVTYSPRAGAPELTAWVRLTAGGVE